MVQLFNKIILNFIVMQILPICTWLLSQIIFEVCLAYNSRWMDCNMQYAEIEQE